MFEGLAKRFPFVFRLCTRQWMWCEREWETLPRV